MSAAPPVVLPVVAPVAQARTRGRVVVLGLAVLLAAPVVVGAVRSVVRSTRPAPEPGVAPSLFAEGARPRVAALRDRLVRGLLSLRRPEGDFSPRTDSMEVHPADRAEATWIGVAGLAAARRMGSQVPGLSEAIVAAKAIGLKRQSKSGMVGVSQRAKRGVQVSAVACAVLALSLSGEPADAAPLDLVGQTLVTTSTFGTLAAGWVQGVAARAMAELVADGRGRLLQPTPVSMVPSRPLKVEHGYTDAHVAQALAEEIQRGLGASPSPLPDEVFALMLGDPPKWVGEQTDVRSWLLEAWLAARRPDGAKWFQLALPELEAGVDEAGVIPGEYYGYPVARTAGALLLLWEGDGPRPAGSP